MPGLFNEYAENQLNEPSESQSGFLKFVVGVLVVGLIIAGGVIAYFGVGPMLVKPYTPPIQSNAPDVTDVLGLNSNQQSSELQRIEDQQEEQQLIQSLAAQTTLPSQEPVAAFLIKQVPQHAPESLFSNAAQGDILFVLTRTGKTYLYRPSTDEIIASGTAKIEQ